MGATTLSRLLHPTPIRLDPTTNELRPGLCSTWSADRNGRAWTFDCSHARAVAREIQSHTPARATVSGRKLVIRLRRPWRRFAYFLAGEDVGVDGVSGPFRVVRSSPAAVTVRRRGLTIVFRRMAPYAALRAFRRGELDEAPVPQGEVGATAADRALEPALRTRRLLGVDLVRLYDSIPVRLRRVLWLTVPRAEYLGLITEGAAPVAYGLLPGGERPTQADVREARRAARGLHSPVGMGVWPGDEAAEAAELVWAEWRQLGLPVSLDRRGGAVFMRLIATYPHAEALFTPLGFPPQTSLTALDRRLRDDALVVPIARVAEARLVNPRVRGWAMDELGRVDYSRVSLEPGP